MPTQIKLVYNHLPRLSREMTRRVGRVTVSTALRVEREAKRSMSEPKTGRVYRRGGVLHRASARGEAPAIDTGNLMNSISSRSSGPTSAIVQANAAYARILEEKIERPFFKPAVEKMRVWFIAQMVKALEGTK